MLAAIAAGVALLSGAAQAQIQARFIPTTPIERFAPGLASTTYSDIRLTISPDGRTALWFSRDRPGGAGGYDIWMARRTPDGWGPAAPVPFNTPGREFDPAFSADGRTVFFCSDRPGGAGGDDLYRVAFDDGRFGAVDSLGPAVNSAGDEFAPMLARDGRRLLFSSDRPGGQGGHDLYVALREPSGFAPARALTGGINTAANEFDAAFLGDDRTIVFARAMDFATGRVDLFVSSGEGGVHGPGERLPEPVNHPDQDTYGAMIDWSAPDRLLISARREAGQGMDLYSVGYRLE
jgi:TolB protein